MSGKEIRYFSEQKHPEIKPETLELAHISDPKVEEKARKALDEFKTRLGDFCDHDEDGLPEITQSDFRKLSKEYPFFAQKPFFTTYFDEKRSNLESTGKKFALPEKLQKATQRHDFKASQAYFTAQAKGQDSPLQAVKEDLAKYLAATLVHAGVGVDYGSIKVQDSTGFSRTKEMKLRGNCTTYAQVAKWNLEKIPDVKFEFIQMSETSAGKRKLVPNMSNSIENSKTSRFETLPYGGSPRPDYDFSQSEPINSDNTGAHMILLVSDGKGHYMTVDNSGTKMLEATTGPEAHEEIKRLYRGQYDYFYSSRHPDHVGKSF